jgi:hypothetical protein
MIAHPPRTQIADSARENLSEVLRYEAADHPFRHPLDGGLAPGNCGARDEKGAVCGTASGEPWANRRGPPSVPGILSPRKITVKGAPPGRVAMAMAKRDPRH